MSVTDSAGPAATSGMPSKVVPPDMLTANDFIGVRAALVKLFGGDGNRALVFTRIFYRADARWREAHEDEAGLWWWRATYAVLADETGLSEQQARRCVKWLVDEGYVVAREFRHGGITDRTLSFRLSISTDSMSEATDQSLSDSTDLPIQTVKTTPTPRKSSAMTEMTEDWLPSEADVAWAKGKGYEVAHLQQQTERFINHFIASGGRKKEWGRAWRNWVGERFVQPRTGAATAGARPQRDSLAESQRIIALGRDLDAAQSRSQPLPLEGL